MLNHVFFDLRNPEDFQHKMFPRELFQTIFDFIDSPDAYKSWIFSCKDFAAMASPGKVLALSNHLWTLIKKFPKKSWNWTSILDNPATPWKIAIGDITPAAFWAGMKTDWLFDATWEYHVQHISYNDAISNNHPGFIKTDAERVEFARIGANPTLKWEDLDQFALPEDHDRTSLIHDFSKNPNLNWKIVNSTSPGVWDWAAISCHPNITCDIISENMTKPWVWWDVSRNPNLTLDFITKYPNLDWNWESISANPAIISSALSTGNMPWADIQSTALPWDTTGVSRNPNITIQHVADNINYDWNWFEVCRKSGCILRYDHRNILPTHPDFHTKKCIISYYTQWAHLINAKLTWKLVEDNLYYDVDGSQERTPWDWGMISAAKFYKS